MSREDRDSQDSVISLFAGLGVGLLLGGAIALLLAPQPGQQTRAQLKETADDALGRLRESMDELRAKVEEVTTSAREAIATRRTGEPDALQGGAASATDEDEPGSPA